MNDQELVKRVVAMLTKLRGLGGADKIYVFSPFYKPVAVPIDTLFGVLANFESYHYFSEDKVRGFKDIAVEYSDIMTGFIRIGPDVYRATPAHEYKIVPKSIGKELVKSLVNRSMKVGRFDLSMMNPGWLSDEDEHKDVDVPAHKMTESESDEQFTDDPDEAVALALADLQATFGDVYHDQNQIDEMVDMLIDAEAPYVIEKTPSQDGIQVVGQNNVGVALYNYDGKLRWEF